MRFLLIFLTIFISQTVYAITAENTSLENVQSKHKPVLISFGDSITEGGTATDDWGWRGPLQDLQNVAWVFRGQYTLPASGYTPYDSTYNKGHAGLSGDDCGEVEARVDTNLDTYMPAADSDTGIVFLMCGTNNTLSTAEGRAVALADTEDIIDLIVAHDADITIYVGLVTPTNSGGGVPHAYVSTYNAELVTMLEGYGKLNLFYVDQYSSLLSDRWGYCSGDWTNCMFDTVHPNDLGYDTMARQWWECIMNEKGIGCNGN